MNRVYVGTAIQKKLDDCSRASQDCAMKRRASRPVATIEQRGIRIQQLAHTTNMPCFGGKMNRMILVCFRRRRSATTIASLFENSSDGVVATFLRHVYQAFTVVAVPFRVCACIEQDLNDLRMTFANRKMDWRSIEVSLAA